MSKEAILARLNLIRDEINNGADAASTINLALSQLDALTDDIEDALAEEQSATTKYRAFGSQKK